MNFTLKKEIPIESIDSTGFLYEHTSGAQLIFIKNDDINKVFSVAFKTLPSDDKGAPHVLEHCTLCGSKKYPLKDTFNEISFSSLYTYLNAITFKDKTVYPIASTNDGEFAKLTKIYLDCVFNPLLRFETFLHEAWHYEKMENGLDVNGVVYSEMKSTFSNPVRETRSFIHKKLFPSTFYKYESSGVPKEILKLQHQEIVDLHKNFYTPENCFLYLYGNIDNLDFYFELFDEYLTPRENPNKISIPKQPIFSEPLIANALYDFSGAQKKYFGAGFVIDTALNLELVLAFNVLNSYLAKMVGAPLKRFLPLVKTFLETEIYQPVYSILSENFNGSTEKFKDTILQIFRQIYKSGLNKPLLESCINNYEFDLRTSFHKNRPKGLVLNLLMLTDWIYDGNPFSKIERIKVLNSLRKKIHEGYFEDLIRKYIIFNTHAVFTSLIPDSKNPFQFNVSAEDMKNAKLMKNFIESKDNNENLIPIAKVDETKFLGFCDSKEYPTEKILYTPMDTEQIIYLRFAFRTDCVPEKLLPYVGILAETLVFTALQENSNESMQTIINNIGHIKMEFDTYSKDNTKFIPMLNLKIKLLPSNIDSIIEITHAIFSIKTFNSKSLIKKLLLQKFALMTNSFIKNPIENIVKKINSYNSDEYKYKDIVDGICFYYFIKNLNQNFDDEYDDLIEKLLDVFKIIFTRENSILQIVCDEKNFAAIHSKLINLMQSLPTSPQKSCSYDFKNYKTDEAFHNLTTINTNAMIIPLDIQLSGFCDAFETFMDKIYLMREIRVMGGAYDSNCKFKNNAIYFYSYADSNIEATYKKFLAAADYALNFQFSDEQIQKCIVSAINVFDKLKSVENRAETTFSQYITETSRDEILQTRTEIISTKVEDIKNIAQQIKNNSDKTMVCTIGNRNKIFDARHLFADITKL